MISRQRGNIHSADSVLLATLFGLVIFGLIALSSASTVAGYENFRDSNYYVWHQILYGVLIGSAGFWIASRVDYHRWKQFAVPLILFTILALIAVLIPGIGFEYGGARRWIDFGFFFVQPSEIAKLTFLLYLATWFESRGKQHVSDFYNGLTPFLILLGIIGFLIMLQPDMGTMSVIAMIALTLYFVAGADLKHFTLIGAAGALLIALLIRLAPYRAARFTVFLNPQFDPQGIGYHVNQALLAIGSGGIFGLGLGHSRQKYNYLPEVTGDSIFAVIAEEMGFIVAVGVIILFLLLMVRGYRIARQAPDEFGKLLAVGITTWFVFQASVNIGAMVSVLPLTGIPLPFISYGSSAMILSMVAMGILVNISKQTR
ncbi:MAG: putative lipid II flippase FtsW [Patescibacteria group bacterium]